MPLEMYKEEKISTPKQIIAIAAGKGGVGKSTVTVNLALALKEQGYSVGILDADVYGPSIRQMLPEEQMPLQNGDRMMPAHSKGISLISMAYFRDASQSASVRAPIANNVVTQFLKNVEWGGLDFLLIDFPPGTGDIQLTIAQQASLTGAIMVTTPQEVSLLDVRKAMGLFAQVNVPVLGIVENMSFALHQGEKVFIFGQGGGLKLATECGAPLLAEIPIDPELCIACDEGKSLSNQSGTTQVFHKIAEKITAHKNEPTLFIKEFNQIDPQSFSITWNDDEIQQFRLSDLQKQCPCASCVDETTGERVSNPESVDVNVGATAIDSVGRYAIKVHFTSGCSTGIYDYEMLRSMSSD